MAAAARVAPASPATRSNGGGPPAGAGPAAGRGAAPSGGGPVRVELLTVPGCPHADAARCTLRACLAELGLETPVTERAGAFPSPSIVVDGRDVMGRTALTGATCRLDPPTRERVLA